MKRIGFTTTIPVEFILAGGNIPVDLNNIFVCSPNPNSLIDEAQNDGLPRNCCSWIKGLYSVAVKEKAVDEIISVTNGDCSNTHALTELYSANNIKVYPFAYPYEEKEPYTALKNQMLALFGADLYDRMSAPAFFVGGGKHLHDFGIHKAEYGTLPAAPTHRTGGVKGGESGHLFGAGLSADHVNSIGVSPKQMVLSGDGDVRRQFKERGREKPIISTGAGVDEDCKHPAGAGVLLFPPGGTPLLSITEKDLFCKSRTGLFTGFEFNYSATTLTARSLPGSLGSGSVS